MIHFKACPRCRGDMSFTGDQYGGYLECLQCGYEADFVKGGMDYGLAEGPREEVAVEAA